MSEGLRQVATALDGLANYSLGRTFRHLFEDEDEGATNVSFTLQVYGHVLPGQQADAAAAVARLVDGP